MTIDWVTRWAFVVIKKPELNACLMKNLRWMTVSRRELSVACLVRQKQLIRNYEVDAPGW